jgi:hypothetical protein
MKKKKKTGQMQHTHTHADVVHFQRECILCAYLQHNGGSKQPPLRRLICKILKKKLLFEGASAK